MQKSFFILRCIEKYFGKVMGYFEVYFLEYVGVQV